jgi:HK97 family phage prohead protease
VEFRSAAGLIERRINPASAEFRPELRMAGDSAHITGYGSVFGKLSRKLGGFVERVDSRAFSASQGAGWPGVICRYNHSDDWLLGTIQGNTLELRVDANGLYYDVSVPETRGGQDVLVLMRRGDIISSSFAFRVPDGGDDWGLTPYGYPLRTLLDTDLVDVAPVNTPAYPDATAQARSIDGAVESLAKFVQASPAEVRSLLDDNQAMKFFKRTDRPSARSAEEADVSEEDRKKLTSKARKELPNSAFAYVDPDGVGHFPIHDANHVRNALAQIAKGAKFGQQALPKVKAAAKKLGVDSQEQNDWLDILAEERREELPEWFVTASVEEDRRLAEEERASMPPKPDTDDDADDEDDEDEDDTGKGASKKGAKKPPFPPKGSKADNSELNSGDQETESAEDSGDNEERVEEEAVDAEAVAAAEARRLRLYRLRFDSLIDNE